MRSIKKLITGILAGVVSVLFCASMVTAASVEIKAKDGIGSYLTDEKGMTLYLFKKDVAGKSACAGACVEKWPLFAVETVTVPEGVKGTDFGTILREDGKKQTTYKGLPLYYYFKDVKPGDTEGQGVYDVWHVVAP